MPSGTGGMGTGSDTRIYNPRSESTRMFGYEDEDIGHAHGEGDPDVAADKAEKKRNQKEEKKKRQTLHHLRIKHKDVLDALPDDGEEVSQEGDDELAPKEEDQNELSAMTGASGSRGGLLDQAVGAKTGTGSALGGTPPLLGPMGVYRSSDEMELAWAVLKGGEESIEKWVQAIPMAIRAAGALMGRGAAQAGAKGVAQAGAKGVAQAGAKEAAKTGAKEAAKEAAKETAMDAAMDASKTGLEGMSDAANPANQMQQPQQPQQPQQQQQQQQRQPGQQQPQEDYAAQARQSAEMMRQHHMENQQQQQMQQQQQQEQIMASEPMDLAWSMLKSKKDKGEGALASGEIGSAGTSIRRRKEQAKKWAQPPFKGAPGGRRPWTATSRRSKARSRTLAPRHRVHNIKGGLMDSPLAVHMSHLGVQTKQPMRQFPDKYRQYYGQQLRRRLQGNVALPYSPHSIMGERSQYPGATGGGRLPGLLPGQASSAHMPSLRRLARPRMPRLRQPSGFSPMTPPTIPTAPPLPQPAQVGLPSSSIQMSEDDAEGSSLQKNLDILRPGTHAYLHSREVAKILRELKEAIQREKMKKGKGTADTSGAGDDKPDAPANGPKQTTRPEGATETDPDDDPRCWGMEPSALIGRH